MASAIQLNNNERVSKDDNIEYVYTDSQHQNLLSRVVPAQFIRIVKCRFRYFLQMKPLEHLLQNAKMLVQNPIASNMKKNVKIVSIKIQFTIVLKHIRSKLRVSNISLHRGRVS